MELISIDTATVAAMPEGGAAIMELFDVMDELKDVIAAENDLLDIGMPAALSELSEIKTQLAEDFQELSSEVLADYAAEIAADPALGRRIMEAGMELRALTQANLERLSSAVNATRRRIEAVMMAIRDHDQENRTYVKGKRMGPGMVIGARYVDYAVNYKI